MKILAPVDGSEHSTHVVEALAARAWPDGTIIKLVTVIADFAAPYRVKGGYGRIDQRPLEHAPSEAHQRLAHLAGSLQGRVRSGCRHVFVDPEIVVGNVREAILAIADHWQPDLIAVGSRGRGALEQILIGSVSASVVSHARSPVLVAREPSCRAPQPDYRVLAALDNSVFSEAAVRWLARQKWSRPTEIRLMTVIPELERLIEEFEREHDSDKAALTLLQIEAVKAHPLAVLKSWEEEIAANGSAVRVHSAVVGGEPRELIAAYAGDWCCDLIVMGSHGQYGFGRYLLGSVSRAVSQCAPCSVEVVRADWLSREPVRHGDEPGQGDMRTTSFPVG